MGARGSKPRLSGHAVCGHDRISRKATGYPAGAGASAWSTARSRAGTSSERFRLFFIIVLGETVLTMGTVFPGEFEAERLLALAIGCAGSVTLWWRYFQRIEARGVEQIQTADDAGAIGLWAMWTLTLIVLGLIGIAVGDELTVTRPGGDATLGFTVLAFGGPALPARPAAVPVPGVRARPALTGEDWRRSQSSRWSRPRSR
jgi:hypothetical protein